MTLNRILIKTFFLTLCWNSFAHELSKELLTVLEKTKNSTQSEIYLLSKQGHWLRETLGGDQELAFILGKLDSTYSIQPNDFLRRIQSLEKKDCGTKPCLALLQDLLHGSHQKGFINKIYASHLDRFLINPKYFVTMASIMVITDLGILFGDLPQRDFNKKSDIIDFIKNLVSITMTDFYLSYFPSTRKFSSLYSLSQKNRLPTLVKADSIFDSNFPLKDRINFFFLDEGLKILGLSTGISFLGHLGTEYASEALGYQKYTESLQDRLLRISLESLTLGLYSSGIHPLFFVSENFRHQLGRHSIDWIHMRILKSSSEIAHKIYSKSLIEPGVWLGLNLFGGAAFKPFKECHMDYFAKKFNFHTEQKCEIAHQAASIYSNFKMNQSIRESIQNEIKNEVKKIFYTL